MTCASILQNDFGADRPLRQRIDVLFDEQRQFWPALRDGELAHSNLQSKVLAAGDAKIIVQLNPARRSSVLARTDAQAIAARPCFLCPGNMPAEERGLAFEDLVLLPNPFPVLPLHCTVASREHRPQRIAGRVRTFLRLAEAVGPDMAAFYNGPRCGASAPDHFHFQCGLCEQLPILRELPETVVSVSLTEYSSFSRMMLVIQGTDVARVVSEVERTIDCRRSKEAPDEEPMFNLFAHCAAGNYTVVLFPRLIHRPACYFATGAERVAVSPGVLEMCGVFVVTDSADFERLDAEFARAIFCEVSGFSTE